MFDKLYKKHLADARLMRSYKVRMPSDPSGNANDPRRFSLYNPNLEMKESKLQNVDNEYYTMNSL